MPTKNEKRQYDKIARLGCIICRLKGYETKDTGCELHHVRRYGAKRENSPVVPLCREHHRGNSGVHGLGTKGFEKHYNLSCQELVDKVNELLNEIPSN